MNCEYTLECLPDDVPVVGNALASGDAEWDRRVENEILERLRRGDERAWCFVRVTCTIEVEGETFVGTAGLGGCSYDNEKAFREDPYFEDLKVEAREDAMSALALAVKRGEVASRVLDDLRE